VVKKDDPEKPDFVVLIPSRVVLADAAGRGALALEVDNHADKPVSSPVHFQVEGAEITGISYSGTGTLDPASLAVTTGKVRLRLQNLDPSTPLTVTTWKEKPPNPPQPGVKAAAGAKPAKLFPTTATVAVRLAFPIEVATSADWNAERKRPTVEGRRPTSRAAPRPPAAWRRGWRGRGRRSGPLAG
jgi:hypothetical protein